MDKYKWIVRVVPEDKVEDKLHECEHYGYEIVGLTPHVLAGDTHFAIVARKPAGQDGGQAAENRLKL